MRSSQFGVLAMALTLAGLVCLTTCSAPRDEQPPTAATAASEATPAPEQTQTQTQTQTSARTRPTTEQILLAIRTSLKATSPRLADDVTWTLDDLTTDEVWTQLGVAIVKLTSQPRQDATFIIRGDTAREIGSHFGSEGVTSYCVADVNGDDHPDLAYSFRWGSGMTRSELAWLDVTSEPPVENNLGVSGFTGRLDVSTDATGRVAVSKDDVLRGHFAFADGKTTLEFVEGETSKTVLGRD